MASKAGFIHHRPLHPSPFLEEPGNLTVNDRHMLEPQVFNPRKRQRSEQHAPQLNGTNQPRLKRGKLSHPPSEVRSRTSPAFYDNLSKIWLTKHALRELDRRNAQLAPSLPYSSRRGPRKPFTRHALAEVEKKHPSTQSVSDFLCNCTSRCLKDIKQLARRGGPDLLDLRGVCIAKYLLATELTILL